MNPLKIEKPWGHEILWAKTKDYAGKVLVILKGHRLSLQYHQNKEETIRLQKGLMELETGDQATRQKTLMKPGDHFHIPPGLIHRMIAIEDCEVVEVSTPQLDDVVRLKDDYDRVK